MIEKKKKKKKAKQTELMKVAATEQTVKAVATKEAVEAAATKKAVKAAATAGKATDRKNRQTIVVMMITAEEKIAEMMVNEVLKLSDASSFVLSDRPLPHSFAFPFAVH